MEALQFYHELMATIRHGFMKKTQQTPKADLALARKRQKIVKEALS